MALLLVSFAAGILTVLAPCILPLLPIIIGGSLQSHERRSPLIITASLAVSIVLFTFLLKVSTVFIDVPQRAWGAISGGMIIFFGLITLFPAVWEAISVRWNLGGKTDALLASSAKKKTYVGDMLLGAALGPVFTSCSPTYFLILATVLPQSFVRGLLDLIAYALGLSLILLLIARLGQRFVRKLQWAANPHGRLKRGLGLVFLVVGIFIATGADKEAQTYLLEKGYFDVTKLEIQLLELFDR